MKKLIALLLALCTIEVFALDNIGWLERARECLAQDSLLTCDETDEDGLYCISIAKISMTKEVASIEQAIGEAELIAKRNLSAYIHGETMTAERSIKNESITTQSSENTITISKFHQKMESKVDALIRGTKIIGQVSYKEESYLVCVTSEYFEDDAIILQAAQKEFGGEGVVKSVGEAADFETAKQKAIRGAIEQVLGTIVVGYDKMSSSHAFKSKIFSGTDGVIDEYRILEEKKIATGVRVELVAKVSKRSLLENYSNYMQFLGDPAFFIKSNAPDLESQFTQFFIDLGIRIAPNPTEATYIILCDGEFRDIIHPINGRHGKQLSLRFRIQEVNGVETLIDMKNDPRKASNFIGQSAERQTEICAQKAFAQMKQPLHEKIQAMISKLVGRKMKTIQDAD